MLDWVQLHCPYCGEPFETAVDCSAGDRQLYVEDCQICCQPILFRVRLDPDGTLQELQVQEENQ